MNSFVVYLTLYNGDRLPKWYIGHSTIDKVENGYNGTVASKKYKKIYLEEQKNNKKSFRTKILSFHNSRKDALKEEERLQRKHSVLNNDKYMNMSYASSNGFFGLVVFGKDHPAYNKKYSKDFCEDIRLRQLGVNNSFYGKKHTKECISRISLKTTGEKNHFYGKKHTKETLKKISERSGTTKGTTYIYNTKLMITKRVKGNELKELLKEGWKKGRKKW